MGGEADAGTDANTRFIMGRMRVPGGDNDTGFAELTDYRAVYLFRRQGYFTDHICVSAEKRHQRWIGRADQFRVMRTRFSWAQPWAFKMQTQCFIGILCQIGTHHFHRALHHFVGAGNKGRQIAGAARAFIGPLHGGQRFDAQRVDIIIKLNATTAVQLQIDKAGSNYRTTHVTRCNASRNITQGANALNQAISNDNSMIIQYFVTGKNSAMG